MDATGVVLRQPLRFSSSSFFAAQSSSKEFRTSSASTYVRPWRRASKTLSSGFCNQGHVKYYNSNFGPSLSSKAASGMMMTSAVSGKNEKTVKDKAAKKMKKKQLKLLKKLSRDLSTFSQLDFGLDSNGALFDQVQANMISEAAELMSNQFQKLKAEEKELNITMKEEKARLRAVRRQNNVINREVSFSSSSESSSDSECGEIVDKKNLKSKQTTLQQAKEHETTTSTYTIPVVSTVTPSSESNALLERSSSCNARNQRDSPKMNNLRANLSDLVVPTCTKRIEVCMGGKCKKLGAEDLLNEFQKVVEIEGAVSGCKCMGKCRDGPNVKVSRGFHGLLDDRSAKTPSISLCIGVRPGDVDMIVANFLGENFNQNQVGFAAAC